MSVPQDVLQEFQPRRFWSTRSVTDWLWALAVIAGGWFAYHQYGALMDVYEVTILALTVPAVIALGWAWRSIQVLTIVLAVLSLFGMWLYGADYVRGEQNFFLKYMLASQSAVMWMNVLFVMATVAYFWGLFARSEFVARTGTAMAWCAINMGLVGMMMRWRESYLINPEYGHIPVSNLYEVFILFCVIAGLIYLFYEKRTGTRALGGFAMLVISAAVGFILWYTFDREAHAIQPLVPALQSYWMKIHVPANFIGYGAFALAAMLGVAHLLQQWSARSGGLLSRALPGEDVIDDLMYKIIALGFAFFTVATILGALWAAEAWGSYWSWDPKETWALIVWLNYAAWLHMRISKGWRGTRMAWWAVIGLFVTLFAFLGVNMFLSGLHSYGEL
jgi:cytochrome c-type biogenesis protein CcsB